jgi:hypothetical protein
LIIVTEDGRATVLMVAIAVHKWEARGHLSDVFEEHSETFEVICRHCRNVALHEAAAQWQAKEHGVNCSRRWRLCTQVGGALIMVFGTAVDSSTFRPTLAPTCTECY